VGREGKKKKKNKRENFLTNEKSCLSEEKRRGSFARPDKLPEKPEVHPKAEGGEGALHNSPRGLGSSSNSKLRKGKKKKGTEDPSEKTGRLGPSNTKKGWRKEG